MSLHTDIADQMKEAMRSKDSITLNTLRALKSALKYAAIEKLGAERELDGPDAIAVIRKQIKQRRDSLESFQANGRPELAEKEQAELSVLERFLPAALTEAEIDALVTAVIAETGAAGKADMGKVMKALQQRTEGRADGRALSQAVGKQLK
ncbi:MAG: aspartyl/glutamyl-trna amidotransferase subunit b-related [Verrucomicrobiales bacterium]|nr:aspartyl/glutamyl-trna amidotransferase subunit b-related [Verrucomicrobiales bacterium]